MKLSYKYIVVTALIYAVSGCTDRFEDINTDKNRVNPDIYPPEYNLTRAQLEYSGNNDFSYEVWRVNIIYAGMMMQQLANTSWYSGDKYIQNDGFAAAYFDVAYNDQVKYVVDLLELTKDDPASANLHQIGRIMRAMIFHRITDLYGDVPYTEAGYGYYDRIFLPVYNTQQEIYLDMLKELDEAATALDVNGDQPDGDLIYGGDTDQIAKWKKLAYSLMLRLSMRMTKVDPTTAQTWAEKAVTGGVFQSNDDNAFILHDTGQGRTTVNRNSNILSGEWNATGKAEVFLSKTFVDFLKDNNDPRLQYIAKVQSSGSTDPDEQIGLPNGLDQNGESTDVSTDPNFPGNITNYSTIREDIFLSLTGPTFFVTYAQTELLLAEAKKRGWNVGATSAQEHYENGVAAAMQQLSQYNAAAEISPDAINTYLAANPYDDSYEQINTQYWAASFLDWYETWSNWRRSGFPNLVPVNYVGNATGGQIPRRMLYPVSEATDNADNYAAAIGRQGSNTFMTRVWWDAE